MITEEVRCNFCIQQKSCRYHINYDELNEVEQVNDSEQEENK